MGSTVFKCLQKQGKNENIVVEYDTLHFEVKKLQCQISFLKRDIIKILNYQKSINIVNKNPVDIINKNKTNTIIKNDLLNNNILDNDPDILDNDPDILDDGQVDDGILNIFEGKS